MRKVFPGLVGYVFLSINIASILGACMKPVGANPFLIGDRSESGVKVNVDVRFEEPTNFPPELKANIGGEISQVVTDGTVNLGDKVIIITVTNMAEAEYDAIEWYFDDTNPLTVGVSGVKNSILTVDMTIAPFNEAGRYPVSVVGQKGAERYSTLFYINVGS